MSARVLLLGGTGEARALAEVLLAQGHPVTTSLAGRVARPRLPGGEVRIGGFGGVAGLRDAVTSYDVVVDATHPFAATISAHAAAACAATSDRPRVPLLRLARPGWSARPDADGWTWVEDHRTAARVAAGLGRRPLLTVGRQSLAAFTGPLSTYGVLARVVDPPEVPVPPAWEVRLDRGPYDVAGESALMGRHRSDVLVTKDSGGAHTVAKLDAAAALGVPVVVVRRPAPPPGVVTVADVGAAAAWVRAQPG